MTGSARRNAPPTPTPAEGRDGRDDDVRSARGALHAARVFQRVSCSAFVVALLVGILIWVVITINAIRAGTLDTDRFILESIIAVGCLVAARIFFIVLRRVEHVDATLERGAVADAASYASPGWILAAFCFGSPFTGIFLLLARGHTKRALTRLEAGSTG